MKVPVILAALVLLSGCSLLPPDNTATSVSAIPSWLQPPALPPVVEVAKAADIYERAMIDNLLGVTWQLPTLFTYSPASVERPFGIIHHRFADVWMHVAASTDDFVMFDEAFMKEIPGELRYRYEPIESVIIPIGQTKYYGQLFGKVTEYQGVEEMKEFLQQMK